MDPLIRNNVAVTGSGERTIVFAHGFGCDQHMWRLVAPAFENRYRVVLFDLVGAGQSNLAAYDTKRHATLHGHASDVLEVLAALDLGRVVFVGHSVSAMIGLLAANDAPERFASLVLVAPSPRYIDDKGYTGGFTQQDIDELLDTMDQNYLGWSGSMAPTIMDHPDRPELASELGASFCRTDPTIARHFARVTFLSDHRADLPRTRTPSLIVQCARDVLAPVAVGEYLYAQMPGSRLAVIDTAGHCPHLSAPGQTVAAIDYFLGEQNG